jgi:predicted dithiol-disulfide oxidoreductase (DUF899 family)
MRSIGVKNRNMVKRLTLLSIERRRLPWGEIETYQGIEDEVREQLPVELWDIWEMADQEITRIIDDTINNQLRT